MDKFEELLVNKGLYDAINISLEDLAEMQKYLSKSEYTDNNIDCYCVNCETNRVFKYINCEVREETGTIRMNIFDDNTGRSRKITPEKAFNEFLNRRYSLTYCCTREKAHTIIFDLITTDNQIMKVGQFPSIADMTIPEIKKYRTILGKQYRDFSKAVGLFANGIGIGSFVYLRRIIENLVQDKFSQASSVLDISADIFSKLHFDEKIDKLKDYLPELLVSNKNFYGIVSKGIHELSEEECLSMFPYIKMGIELILDNILAEKENAKKSKEFQKFVSETKGKLK
jgi:hypothetical protein